MELISRRVIADLEGTEDVSEEVLAEYADCTTERYKNMVEDIKQARHFDSLKYQTLENLLDSVQVDRCRLCTYCWDGRE